jgi:alkanesulfonate monooxygenase SsuD/methylene tetrahydromethanopterin reductase-like flavin-dependent oxidoreductase (luciferase family)
MAFGINFFSSVRQEQKSAAQYFDEALRLATLADELGYSHVRTVEHYFRPYGGMTPNPIVFLSAVAGRTKQIRLVTGAVIPIFNHPVKLAGELAMLDAISGGRLTVGFARAFLPEEFEAFERSMDESRERYEHGIEAVRRLWTETDLVYQDRFYKFGPLTSSPKPTQQPHPPIMVAAIGSPASFEWAARQGYGLMVVPYLSRFDDLRVKIDHYREVFRDTHPGVPVPPVQMSMHLHVADTDERAVAEATEPMALYIQVFRESAAAWAGRSSKDYLGYEQVIGELDTMTIDRVLREDRGFIGSPATVLQQVRKNLDYFGDMEPSLSILWGNMSYEASEHSLRLFAEEVMPKIR